MKERAGDAQGRRECHAEGFYAHTPEPRGGAGYHSTTLHQMLYGMGKKRVGDTNAIKAIMLKGSIPTT